MGQDTHADDGCDNGNDDNKSGRPQRIRIKADKAFAKGYFVDDLEPRSEFDKDELPASSYNRSGAGVVADYGDNGPTQEHKRRVAASADAVFGRKPDGRMKKPKAKIRRSVRADFPMLTVMREHAQQIRVNNPKPLLQVLLGMRELLEIAGQLVHTATGSRRGLGAVPNFEKGTIYSGPQKHDDESVVEASMAVERRTDLPKAEKLISAKRVLSSGEAISKKEKTRLETIEHFKDKGVRPRKDAGQPVLPASTEEDIRLTRIDCVRACEQIRKKASDLWWKALVGAANGMTASELGVHLEPNVKPRDAAKVATRTTWQALRAIEGTFGEVVELDPPMLSG